MSAEVSSFGDRGAYGADADVVLHDLGIVHTDLKPANVLLVCDEIRVFRRRVVRSLSLLSGLTETLLDS